MATSARKWRTALRTRCTCWVPWKRKLLRKKLGRQMEEGKTCTVIGNESIFPIVLSRNLICSWANYIKLTLQPHCEWMYRWSFTCSWKRCFRIAGFPANTGHIQSNKHYINWVKVLLLLLLFNTNWAIVSAKARVASTCFNVIASIRCASYLQYLGRSIFPRFIRLVALSHGSSSHCEIYRLAGTSGCLA